MNIDNLKEELMGASQKASQEMVNSRTDQLKTEFWRGVLCGLDSIHENIALLEARDADRPSDEDEAV